MAGTATGPIGAFQGSVAQGLPGLGSKVDPVAKHLTCNLGLWPEGKTGIQNAPPVLIPAAMPQQLSDNGMFLEVGIKCFLGLFIDHLIGTVEVVADIAHLFLDFSNIGLGGGNDRQAHDFQDSLAGYILGGTLLLGLVLHLVGLYLTGHHVQDITFPLDDLTKLVRILGDVFLHLGHPAGDDPEQLNQPVVERRHRGQPHQRVQHPLRLVDHGLGNRLGGDLVLGLDHLPGAAPQLLHQLSDLLIGDGLVLGSIRLHLVNKADRGLVDIALPDLFVVLLVPLVDRIGSNLGRSANTAILHPETVPLGDHVVVFVVVLLRRDHNQIGFLRHK